MYVSMGKPLFSLPCYREIPRLCGWYQLFVIVTQFKPWFSITSLLYKPLLTEFETPGLKVRTITFPLSISKECEEKNK